MTGAIPSRAAWLASLIVAIATFAIPRVARGAGASCTTVTSMRAEPWASPLDHLVSLHARDISLRAALDHLSATSQVAFAYSSDLVALERRVCVAADDRPLGDVLDALLDGSGVTPMLVAGRVVLGPRAEQAPVPRRPGVDVLERVVVTGNPVATARRQLAIGVEVIDGDLLRRQSVSSLAEMLNAGVPGVWMWAASPGSLVSQYAGVRGASSFGTAAPKIYVDGIEVANPLLITQVNPDLVDHIEVIRGPQGSALYGSDAISGVINMVTRHDAGSSGGTRVSLSSAAGASQSAFGAGLVPTHEQRVALRTGTNLRTGSLSAQFGQTGAIVPAVNTRDFSLAADSRIVGGWSTWSASARYADRRAGKGQNPLLRGLSPAVNTADSASTSTTGDVTPQSARQYTVGTTVALASEGPFTHSLLVGVDGYRLDHVVVSGLLYPVPADSSLGATQGSGDRSTVRLSTVGRFGGSDGVPATTLAFGLDHSVLRQQGIATTTIAPVSGSRYPVARDARIEQWNHNAGAFTQLSAALNDEVYLSAGVRIEQNDAFTGSDRHPLLPMLGIASVHEIGPASVKVRAAYGKGIRPPTLTSRGSVTQPASALSPAVALDPEAQSGTEIGVELYVGKTASLQLTRFDQVVSGLVQNVFIGVDTQVRSGRVVRHMIYQLQNVGEIGNHGWEVHGTIAHDAASLTTALTIVDSRVAQVARGYGGDLRAGDPMLGVPRRTGSVTAAWNPSGWSSSLSVSRAGRWINYDRLGLARDYGVAGAATRELNGSRLRTYWKEYAGDTHLRLSATHALRGALELLVVGDNLVGGQLGEPDNVTIRAGRTITAGLRSGF